MTNQGEGDNMTNQEEGEGDNMTNQGEETI